MLQGILQHFVTYHFLRVGLDHFLQLIRLVSEFLCEGKGFRRQEGLPATFEKLFIFGFFQEFDFRANTFYFSIFLTNNIVKFEYIFVNGPVFLFRDPLKFDIKAVVGNDLIDLVHFHIELLGDDAIVKGGDIGGIGCSKNSVAFELQTFVGI